MNGIQILNFTAFFNCNQHFNNIFFCKIIKSKFALHVQQSSTNNFTFLLFEHPVYDNKNLSMAMWLFFEANIFTKNYYSQKKIKNVKVFPLWPINAWTDSTVLSVYSH